MTNTNNETTHKILQDFLCKKRIECRAVINWFKLPTTVKRKKIRKYNKILQNYWNIQSQLEWPDDFFELNEIQRRLLLKNELINVYNNLSIDDKRCVNSILELNENHLSWICLTSSEKKKLLKAVFNFF